MKGYVTPIEAASALGLDYNDPQTIVDLSIALEFIEDAAEEYCNTKFEREDAVAKIYSGSGLPMLSLGLYLRNLTSVEVVSNVGDVVTDITSRVATMPQPSKSGVYRWLECQQVVPDQHNTVFPRGLNNIRVTGDWGFVTTPTGIKMAIILGLKHFFELREYSDLKVTEGGFGRLTEFTAGKDAHYLPAVARKLLDRWKNGNWASE